MLDQKLLEPLLLFKEQFNEDPALINEQNLVTDYTRIIVCGMGGSSIAAHFLSLLFPNLPIITHRSYGIPKNSTREDLFIIVSYSGNTEETLDSLKHALLQKYTVAIITKGGKLLEEAKGANLPYILLTESGLEPRFAVGYQMIALLTLLQEKEKIVYLRKAINSISLEQGIQMASTLTQRISHSFPILYSSQVLYPLLYPIKAAINEGAKTPCFVNIIPEANHNELQSFVDGDHEVTHIFSFIFFKSTFDHPRIQKRLDVMKRLYEEKGFMCEEIVLDHTEAKMTLETLFVGYALATLLAIEKKIDPYQTPFIKKFKETLIT